MNKDTPIFICGASGLAGSSVFRELKSRGYSNILTKRHSELDLRNSEDVEYFLKKHKPRVVVMAAAHAGGIMEAVQNPALMALDNMEMTANVIRASFLINVEKLIYLASSCCYPTYGPQPYREDQFGTGRTDENWSYASVKIAGVELCRAFHRQFGCNYISLVPCNLYGRGDNYDPKHSHVIPSLLRKVHESDVIELWGDGSGRREFLHTDDFARACVDVIEKCSYEDLEGIVNIGSGEDISILDLVGEIGEVVRPGEMLKLSFNTRMPNGVSAKLMDNSRIRRIGWEPKISLKEGIAISYADYRARCKPD